MADDQILNEDLVPENNSDNGIPIINRILKYIDSSLKKLLSDEKVLNILRKSLLVIASITSVFLISLFILYCVPFLQERVHYKKIVITSDPEIRKDRTYKKQISQLTREVQRLSREYNLNTSNQSYIVINTTKNRFFLYRNKKLIREGFCSSGSYTMLKTSDGGKQWIFKTPKGRYHIQGKTTHPVWRKPDWAFVEEGLPIPPEDDYSRYEYGVLGDYALAIGDGYLIHGTIYKRFLGMPVTHGCVRLNDEDLEAIFNTLSIGSKVYIF